MIFSSIFVHLPLDSHDRASFRYCIDLERSLKEVSQDEISMEVLPDIPNVPTLWQEKLLQLDPTLKWIRATLPARVADKKSQVKLCIQTQCEPFVCFLGFQRFPILLSLWQLLSGLEAARSEYADLVDILGTESGSVIRLEQQLRALEFLQEAEIAPCQGKISTCVEDCSRRAKVVEVGFVRLFITLLPS